MKKLACIKETGKQLKEKYPSKGNFLKHIYNFARVHNEK